MVNGMEEKEYNIVYNNNSKVKPTFLKDFICLVLSSNNDFLKYASVMISSIIVNSNNKHNYDIIILHKDITYENIQLLKKEIENKRNFSLRFINVRNLIKRDNYYVKSTAYHEVTEESYYRLYIPEILSEKYHKVVYLDGDMVSLVDLYKLNKIRIENYYVAATRDFLGIAESYRSDSKGKKRKQYQLNKVKIKNLDDYFIAGLLIMNLKELRRNFNIEEIEELIFKENWNLHDQDVLNYMCRDNNALYLNARWNVVHDYGNIKYLPTGLKKQYFDSIEDPYVIHYAGSKKPWKGETSREHDFWCYAVKTPFFNEIINENICYLINREKINHDFFKNFDISIYDDKELIKNYIYNIVNCNTHTNNGTEKKEANKEELLPLIDTKIKLYIKYSKYLKEESKVSSAVDIYSRIKELREYSIHNYKTIFAPSKGKIQEFCMFLNDVKELVCKHEIIGHIGTIEYELIAKGTYSSWLASLFPNFYYVVKKRLNLN